MAQVHTVGQCQFPLLAALFRAGKVLKLLPKPHETWGIKTTDWVLVAREAEIWRIMV
jgi:hypothetical protein